MQKSEKQDAAKPLIDLTNPHDGYFKSLLGRRAMAVEFLRLYLPKEVTESFDWRTVERVEDSFISEELRHYFSDLIYSVRLKGGETVYVYILLEHKSAPDKWVALQLLGYKVKLWEEAKGSGAAILPMIIPVVFYHGRKRWNVSPRFGDLVEGFGRDQWRRFVPDFEYYLFDLSRYRDDQIAGSAELQTGLMLMKYIFRRGEIRQRLGEIVSRLRALPEDQVRRNLMPIIFYLTATVRMPPPEMAQQLKKALPKVGGNSMQTPAQVWLKEGIQQGLQQGLQQGHEQERANLAQLLIHQLRHRFDGLSQRAEARIRRLPLAELNDLGKLLLDFETVAELNAWLRERNSEPAA
ncbi:MAG: Rpn family recombination-promoting nuclease/putative transposase [Acidobacteriota bacterium]